MPLGRFLDRGGLVLGICNGFQVLVKAGLLPGNPGVRPFDAHLQRLGPLRVAVGPPDSDPRPQPVPDRRRRRSSCPWPTARASSCRLIPRPWPGWRRPVRWCFATPTPRGRPTADPTPPTPTDRSGAVAGLCDPTGRVFGLMPHPERFVDPLHHPRWTRRGLGGEGDGLRIFRNAVKALAG